MILIDSVSFSAKSLEKLTNAACDVACLSCNLTQNRFKNIYPCKGIKL